MFSFDFSNVSLNRPPSEAGVYTVKITDVDSYKARSGALRIGFKSTITDGTHEGCTINDGFNIPKSMSGKGISFWVDFFESLGMNKSEWSSAFSLPDLTVTESEWSDMSTKQRDKIPVWVWSGTVTTPRLLKRAPTPPSVGLRSLM